MRAFGARALCAWLLAGCAAFASKTDYADYRALRMERSEDERLLAMQRYVERHPDGRWYDEVQRERALRDRAVFERGRSDREGLELYLSAFPDGAFASQARSRLEAIAVIEQRKRAEIERAEQLAQERRERDAELSRTWVTRFFGYWMKTLLALDGWGAPIEQVARDNPAFSRAFGRPPRPRCMLDECVKSYESAFAVPVPGGTRVERTMRLLLRLRMEEGRLVRAELLLPGGGFSRWQELEQRHVVVEGDVEARARAAQWALDRVVPLLDQLAGGHEPIEGYPLPAIANVAFGITGELTDTTAEDPSAPPNRIQGSGAPGASQDPAALVRPTAPEPAADMEMDTLHVDEQGRAAPAVSEMALDPLVVPGPSGTGQGELVLAPLTVPRAEDSDPDASGTASTPVAPPVGREPAAAEEEIAVSVEPAVHAFRAGGLRVVVFAASAASPGAMDGVLIEPIEERAKRKRKGGRRP